MKGVHLDLKRCFFDNGDTPNCDEINSLNDSKIFPSLLRIGIINWMNNSEKVRHCCPNNHFLSESIIGVNGSHFIGNSDI